jgi:hypothetical protein
MRCFAVTKAPIVRDDHPAMAAQQVTDPRSQKLNAGPIARPQGASGSLTGTQ